MRKVLSLLLLSLLLSACTVTIGPRRTPEDAYRLKVAEFKVQVDAIQTRIIIGMVDHELGKDGETWAGVPDAADDFRALLDDAAKIEPPVIYQAAHKNMAYVVESFNLAMMRLDQFVETGRQDRYNDYIYQMKNGNGSLARLVELVPPPD